LKVVYEFVCIGKHRNFKQSVLTLVSSTGIRDNNIIYNPDNYLTWGHEIETLTEAASNLAAYYSDDVEQGCGTWSASEFSLSKLEYNVVSKRSSMISWYLDGKLRAVTLRHTKLDKGRILE